MIFEAIFRSLARGLRGVSGEESGLSEDGAFRAQDTRDCRRFGADGTSVAAAPDAGDGDGSRQSGDAISALAEAAPAAGGAQIRTPDPNPSGGFAGFDMIPPEEIMAASENEIAELAEAAGADSGFCRDYLRPLLFSYASYAHLLPASERNHHRGPGGLFRHGLETAMLAVQMSRGLVLDRSSMPGRRRDMEFRWRVGYLVAGLAHDIGKPVSDMIVRSADGRSTWNPFVSSLYQWGRENFVERYYPEWISGRFRRHEQLNLMALDLVLTREIRGFLSPGASRDILVALYNLATGNLLATPLGRIVTMADQESARRDLASLRLDASDLATCIPAERYILEAVIRLMDSGAWTVNRPGARVWVLDSGTYILWRCAGSISQLLDQMRIPAVPRDPEELASILLERGYAEYRWEEQEDGDPARLKYFRIMPDIENATEIDALKLSDGAFIFPRVMPPAIRDLLYDGGTPAPGADTTQRDEPGRAVGSVEMKSAATELPAAGTAEVLIPAPADRSPDRSAAATAGVYPAVADARLSRVASVPVSAAGSEIPAAISAGGAGSVNDRDIQAGVSVRVLKGQNASQEAEEGSDVKVKTLAPEWRANSVDASCAAVDGKTGGISGAAEYRQNAGRLNFEAKNDEAQTFRGETFREAKSADETPAKGVSDPLTLFGPMNFVRLHGTQNGSGGKNVRLPEPDAKGAQRRNREQADPANAGARHEMPDGKNDPQSISCGDEHLADGIGTWADGEASADGIAAWTGGAAEKGADDAFKDATSGKPDMDISPAGDRTVASSPLSPEFTAAGAETSDGALSDGVLSDGSFSGEQNSWEDEQEMDFADFRRINPDLAETLLADDGSVDEGENDAKSAAGKRTRKAGKNKTAVKSGIGTSVGITSVSEKKSGSGSAGQIKSEEKNAAGGKKTAEEKNAIGGKKTIVRKNTAGASAGTKQAAGKESGNRSESRTAQGENPFSTGDDTVTVSADETDSGDGDALVPSLEVERGMETSDQPCAMTGRETVAPDDAVPKSDSDACADVGIGNLGGYPGGDRKGEIRKRKDVYADKECEVGERNVAVGERNGSVGERSDAVGERNDAVRERKNAAEEKEYKGVGKAVAATEENSDILRFAGIALPADSGPAAEFLFALARELASGRRLCGVATNTRRIILTGGLVFDGKGELYQQLAAEKIAEARQGELVKLNLKWSRYLEAAMKASGREPARLPANIMSNLKISARFADLGPREAPAQSAGRQAAGSGAAPGGKTTAFLRDFSPSAFSGGSPTVANTYPRKSRSDGDNSDLSLPSALPSASVSVSSAGDYSLADPSLTVSSSTDLFLADSSPTGEKSCDGQGDAFSDLSGFRSSQEAEDATVSQEKPAKGRRKALGAKMLEADRCLSDLRELLADGELAGAVVTGRGTEISVESFFDFMTRRWPALEKYETLGYLGSSRLPAGRDFCFRLGQVILRRSEA